MEPRGQAGGSEESLPSSVTGWMFSTALPSSRALPVDTLARVTVQLVACGFQPQAPARLHVLALRLGTD